MSQLEDKQLRIILKELRKSKLNKYKDLLSRPRPRIEKLFYNHNSFIKNLGFKELDDRLNDLEWMSKKEEIATSSYEPPLIIDGGINYSIDNNQQGYRPGSIIKLGYDAKSKIVNTKDGKPIIIDVKEKKDEEQKSKRFIIKKGDGLFIDDFKFKKVDKQDSRGDEGGDGGGDREWSRMGYDDILNNLNAIEQETENLPQTNQVSIHSIKEGIFQSSGGVTAATVRKSNVFGSSFRTTNSNETDESLSEETDISLVETDVSLNESVGDYETIDERILDNVLNFIEGNKEMKNLTLQEKEQYKEFLERYSVDIPLIYLMIIQGEDLDQIKENILKNNDNENTYIEEFTDELIENFRKLLKGYESVAEGEDSKFFKHYIGRLNEIKKIKVDERNQEWIENVLNGIILFADYRKLRHINNGAKNNDFEEKGADDIKILSPKKVNKLKIKKDKKRNIANRIKTSNKKDEIKIKEDEGFVSMTQLFEKLIAAGEIIYDEPTDHRRDFNAAIKTNNPKKKLEYYLKLFAYAYQKKPNLRIQPSSNENKKNFEKILNTNIKIPSNIATSKVGEEMYFIDMSKKDNDGFPIAVIRLGILRESLEEEATAAQSGRQSVPQTPSFASPYAKRTKSKLSGKINKDFMETDINEIVKNMGFMPKHKINSVTVNKNKKPTQKTTEIKLYDLLDENDDQNVPVFV